MKEFHNNLAFVFPGQGSQSIGMLTDLANDHAEVKSTFDSASESVGVNLWDLAQNGPEQQLNLTENTQPLMLAAGVAVWRVWCHQTTIRPGWMAGHSLGEFTALVCAGVLDFNDAARLVVKRATLMQQAVPADSGAMAAILGLDDPQIVAICSAISADAVVAPANFNAPGQVVIAGHVGAVNAAIEAAKSQGAKRAVILPVSVPSHCILMKAAAEEFEELTKSITFKTPEIPIIHNVDVASHAAPAVIQSVLTKQFYNPVRWVDTIKFMSEQGVNYFFECGPGKVLSGLNKRIAKGCTSVAINTTKTLIQAVESF